VSVKFQNIFFFFSKRILDDINKNRTNNKINKNNNNFKCLKQEKKIESGTCFYLIKLLIRSNRNDRQSYLNT